MAETITIRKDAFEELIRRKEEFDAVVESIELMNDTEVEKAIEKSKDDIKSGRLHKLKNVLENEL